MIFPHSSGLCPMLLRPVSHATIIELYKTEIYKLSWHSYFSHYPFSIHPVLLILSLWSFVLERTSPYPVLWRGLYLSTCGRSIHYTQLCPYHFKNCLFGHFSGLDFQHISDMVCLWEDVLMQEALWFSKRFRAVWTRSFRVGCLNHGLEKEEDIAEADYSWRSKRRPSKAWILEKRISCLGQDQYCC